MLLINRQIFTDQSGANLQSKRYFANGETFLVQTQHTGKGLDVTFDTGQAVMGVTGHLVIGAPLQPTSHNLSFVGLSPTYAAQVASRRQVNALPSQMGAVAFDGTYRHLQDSRQVFLRGYRPYAST